MRQSLRYLCGSHQTSAKTSFASTGQTRGIKSHLLAGIKGVGFGAGICAILIAASPGESFAQTAPVSQESAWQFNDQNTTVTQMNGVAVMQAMRSHTLGATAASSLSGNGGGLFGLSTVATNNYNVIATSTTNNCTAAAAGATISCGGGSTSAQVTQTTTSSPVNASSTATGNTLTNTQNSGNSNSGDSNSNFH